MNDFLWNQMASVILELKWPCRNGLEKTLINEDLYTGVRAANKRKNVLLNMWQLFSLLLGKKITFTKLLSPPFTLMKCVAAGCFCFFLPCGQIMNCTFLILFLLNISNPQPICESLSSSIPGEELNLFAAKISVSDTHLWKKKNQTMLPEMIASKNTTKASLVILAYRWEWCHNTHNTGNLMTDMTSQQFIDSRKTLA